MRLHEALIAYTPTDCDDHPTAGRVKIGRLFADGERDWTDPYLMTVGAAYCVRRNWRGYQEYRPKFVDFHTTVVRDGIDPQVAHAAFKVVDEYRESIASDIEGSDDPTGVPISVALD